MGLSPICNIFRLTSILIISLPLWLISKEKAIIFFLKLAGPSFLKLGQLLSTRPDLVGEKLAQQLSSFQDNIAPFSQKLVKKIIDQEYPRNFKKIFKNFNFQPIASASIAQVHQATLFDNRQVAVKILRPNIPKIMQRDIATLHCVTKLVSIFSSSLKKSLNEILDLLKQTAKYELDLLLEGANASRLREEMLDFHGFYVPQIFWQYSSSQILVSEWIVGVKISDIASLDKLNIDKNKIAENLVLSYFKQVYVNGFFHADMHPGNLFLLANGDIGVVDFGIMGKIDRKTRIAVAEVLIGFLHRQYHQVAQIHIEAGFVPSDTNVDDLALSCRKIGEMIVGVDVKDISIAKLLTSLITMTRDYKMETRPELLLLQKTLLLVEGVGVTLDPNLNIWDLARPWVKEWAKTNIGFDAQIRDFALGILEKVKKFLSN